MEIVSQSQDAMQQPSVSVPRPASALSVALREGKINGAEATQTSKKIPGEAGPAGLHHGEGWVEREQGCQAGAARALCLIAPRSNARPSTRVC